MPLKPELEAEVNMIADPAQREQLRKILEGNKNLSDGFLAGKDYSRVIQEATKTRKEAEVELEAARRQKTENIDWFKKSEKEFTDLEAEKKRLETELTAATATLKTLKTDGNDPDAQLAARKEIEDLKTQLRTAQTDIEKSLDSKLSSRADGFGEFLLDIVEAKEKHLRDFGKPLEKDTIISYMKENKINTVTEAYEKMTAGDRQKAWESAKEKEIEARVRSQMQMPIDTGSGNFIPPGPKGPLQSYLQKESAVPEGVTADGSGRLASLAAQELRAEGK